MALRGGTKAGVELDAPSLLDHAPAYAPGATWADYSFISRGSEADLFSMHVWSGIAEASVAAEQQPGESTTTVQVRGKPGALIQGPGRLALAWFEHPGVRVLIDNGHGALSREELFEVADGLRRVDEAEWDAYVAGAVGHPPERAAAR
jgi:hypothetical protein